MVTTLLITDLKEIRVIKEKQEQAKMRMKNIHAHKMHGTEDDGELPFRSRHSLPVARSALNTTVTMSKTPLPENDAT
jgi:hypothetical protein